MAFASSNSVDLSWQPIAIPAVSLLVCFLGYSSQYLFQHAESLDPGPLTKNELITFNTLLACLWWSYYRACTTDPGRFLFPKRPTNEHPKDNSEIINRLKGDEGKPLQSPRWCKKCAAPKPARAHHCRHCRRCIPRMDHHCPWTSNCVSYTTFPSFLRFLVWTNITLIYFHLYVLWPRQAALWHNRDLPSYLGPSMPALVHLAFLSLVGGTTTFALAVMLFSTAKSWLLNTTMIEGWEISRHEALLEKQGREGPGCATCPHPNTGSDASDFEDEHYPEPIEFPYDLGFFENMSQGMGSSNPLMWFLPIFGSTTRMPVSPFSPTQPHDLTKPPYSWPENEFNDEYGMWPPLDPEKERRERLYGRGPETDGPATWEEQRIEFEATQGRLSADEMKQAFRRRQEADLLRQRQKIMAELEEVEDYDMLDDAVPADVKRLAKMGVDTAAEAGTGNRREFDGPRVIEIGEDDEDLPLAEVIRRRKAFETDGEN